MDAMSSLLSFIDGLLFRISFSHYWFNSNVVSELSVADIPNLNVSRAEVKTLGDFLG